MCVIVLTCFIDTSTIRLMKSTSVCPLTGLNRHLVNVLKFKCNIFQPPINTKPLSITVSSLTKPTQSVCTMHSRAVAHFLFTAEPSLLQFHLDLDFEMTCLQR